MPETSLINAQFLRNQVQLIAYVDRLAGDLKQLKELLDHEWPGLFGGVHLLPFFRSIDGGDAGFDPVDHTEVDCRLGDWGTHVRYVNVESSLQISLLITSQSTPRNLKIFLSAVLPRCL